jgi:ABC-type glycerol-3-phosphate transport system substrate-binding protein
MYRVVDANQTIVRRYCMKKALLLLLSIALVSTFVFASGNSEPTGPVKVEFLHQAELSDDELTVKTMVEEELNVLIDYNVVSNDQLRTVIATRMAGGDLPDLYQIEDVQPYKDGHLGGLFANISELADTYALGNLLAEIDKVDATYGDIFREDGGYFRLPTLQTKAFGWHYVYRKDWADAAGWEYDGSIESFEELLRISVEAGGSGTTGWTAGGIWFVGTSAAAAFTGESAVDWNKPNLREKNGQWYAVEATDAYRDALRWLNKLYEEGLLDQEIYSANKELAIEKFTNGKAGVLGSNTGWEDQVFNAFTQANPDGEMGALPTAPEGPAGFARGSSPGYYKSWIIGTNSDAQSLAAARVLDLLKSKKYLDIMTRAEGFKNMGGGIGAHSWAPLFGRYGDYSQMHWTVQVGLSNAEEEAVVQDPRYVEYATDISSQYKPEVASVSNDYAPKFVVGDLDINDDAVWDQYLAELDKAGLPILLEDIAAQY